MNVVKLSPNWTLQIIKLIFTLSIIYILSVTFKIVSIFIIGLALIVTFFNIMQLRFLHCYKAGINYSTGMGKRYINTDEIKSISFKRSGILTEVKVVTITGESHRFFNWRVTTEQKNKIKDLYAEKYVGCKD